MSYPCEVMLNSNAKILQIFDGVSPTRMSVTFALVNIILRKKIILKLEN
jgi:hypothetical protein